MLFLLYFLTHWYWHTLWYSNTLLLSHYHTLTDTCILAHTQSYSRCHTLSYWHTLTHCYTFSRTISYSLTPPYSPVLPILQSYALSYIIILSHTPMFSHVYYHTLSCTLIMMVWFDSARDPKFELQPKWPHRKGQMESFILRGPVLYVRYFLHTHKVATGAASCKGTRLVHLMQLIQWSSICFYLLLWCNF